MRDYKTTEDMLRGTERAYWQLVRAFEKYIKEQETKDQPRASSLTNNQQREHR